MEPIFTIAFAFLVGVTACGLAGSALELLAGRRLAFTEPYVSPSHVLRSLGMTALVGPLMLGNDALAAYRERRLSAAALASCGCTALLWCLALGVVLIAVLRAAAALLA